MGKVPKVVIDTNIFISGFGWRGKPKKILKLVEEGKIKNFTSPAIIEEVKRVASYKRLRFPDDLQAEIIEFIYFYSEIVTPKEKLVTSHYADSSKMIFARSVAEVTPSADITWFQTQEACANVGKRLLRNGEWQMAAAGTPDPGTDDESTDCNISGPPFAITPTGSRSNCVSNFGVFDMVGNLFEWVEDWVPPSSTCLLMLSPLYGSDLSCLAETSTTTFNPGALIRGGAFGDDELAGVFALDAGFAPSFSDYFIGFRCVR